MTLTNPIVDLATRLFPFPYSVTGPGNDIATQVTCKELDFKVHEYQSGRELNGWLIPPALHVEKAQIRMNGALIYDGTASPLGVPAQSDSFVGFITLDELRPHLFSDVNDEDAIPYHWSKLYRPDDSVWGFCLPHRLKESLKDGVYEVELTTRKTESATMKVLIHELPGETPDTIIFNAHCCHPYQANDDISGVAVGIELMRRLARLPGRRFTYVLMIAPELFGPMFWLDEEWDDWRDRIRGAVMLKSVGNDRPLRLQASFQGDSVLDRAAHNVFRSRYGSYDHGEFRAIYGNDETVFEAPPYAIPSISLTRWPFSEYHTDKDTPDRLSETRLNDTLEVAFDICRAIELNRRFVNRAKGLVCLSRHGLYRPVPAVGPNGVNYATTEGRWNRLMNALPRLLDGRSGLLEVAERFQLPVQEVHAYIMGWVTSGLAELKGSDRLYQHDAGVESDV